MCCEGSLLTVHYHSSASHGDFEGTECVSIYTSNPVQSKRSNVNADRLSNAPEGMLLILFEYKSSSVKADRLRTRRKECWCDIPVLIQMQLRQSRQTVEHAEGMLLICSSTNPATSKPTDCRTRRKECC